MKIIEKQITPESSVSVEIANGRLSLVAGLDTKGMDAAVQLSVDSDYFLDELAKKIPGVWDDAMIAIIKTALKAF